MISLELLSEENSLDVYSLKKKIESILNEILLPRPANYFDLEGFKRNYKGIVNGTKESCCLHASY